VSEKALTRVCAHFIPGGLVLIALTWLIAHFSAMPASMSELVRYAPHVVFAVGLPLSAIFHRSRIFQALLLLAFANLALVLGMAHLGSPAVDVLVRSVALLLPLNLVLISFLPETGIFTRSAMLRFGVLAIQTGAAAAACRFYPLPTLSAIDRPFVRLLSFESFRGLPHSALVTFTLAFLLLLLNLVHRRFRPTDIGIYWALISGFVALTVAGVPRLPSIAFVAGAIVLVIALLETFYAMAYFDELTDLPSRRSFNDVKLKLGSTYTVAMVDVDHFKNFNDTFGHDAGDQVLRMVASRLADVSGGGKGYRYGGEEFALVFPGKYVDETFPHLERLRKSIEELPFKLRSQDRRGGKKKKVRLLGRRRSSKQQTNITVSIGVAGVAGEKRNADEMVKAADKALYRAKACGRNCTILSES
jgi:GGDEF domain-containing protein